MIKVVSRITVADKGSPRINDVEFERVQELINGQPFYYRRTHDSGAPRKTTFDLGLGMGSQGRGNSIGGMNEPGEEMEKNDPRTPSSWYNNDADAQVDDETKPGHGSIQPGPDGSRGDPYANQDLMIEHDVFVNNKLYGTDESPQVKRRNIKNNMKSVLNDDPVIAPHKRHNVDRR